MRDLGTIGNVNSDEYLENSLARSKAKIYEYARSCAWKIFVTLTFSPETTDRSDFSLCMKRVRNWIQNQRKRYAPDLYYLAVPEAHLKEQARLGLCWHIHILMANTGNMKLKYSGHINKSGQKIYNLTGWSFGFSTAVKLDGSSKIARYITKYCNKSLIMLSKGRHRYYASRNLPKPLETKMIIPPAELEAEISKIIDSTGKNVINITESRGYVDVKYIELE